MRHSDAMGDAESKVMQLAVTDFGTLAGREALVFKMTQLEERAKSQAFFAELAVEISKPSCGDFYRDHVKLILRRAEERGLFQPEPK
jgi:hypothetical protein